MEIKKHEKNIPKFFCNDCQFFCELKSDWIRHTNRAKHLKNIDGNKHAIKKHAKNMTPFECECGKKYETSSGLWKHKKKCDIQENESNEITEKQTQELEEMKEFMKYLMKENSEMKNMMMDVLKTGTHNTHNTNTINSHNKTFNLQVFLNETCKDAMNIMDFIDSIKIQLEDLEDVGKLGYINGISNIIMKNLKALDVTQRPVHCSDSKRETLYVKDQDKWEKEDENNARLRKAIRRIAYKNTKVIRDWRDIHPDHDNSFSKTSDVYQQIVIESMGGKHYETMDTEAKIIKNIAKYVIIDK